MHKICQNLLLVYIYSSYIVGNGAATSTFVVKPGGGKEFIYTPVARNTTLQCSVVSASNLFWIINDLFLPSRDSELSGFTLHQSAPALASMGELTSMLTVNGAIANNRLRICCQTDRFQTCCTSLITFDRPSSPVNITIQSISAGSINITWDAESVAGVDQYYIVNFTSNMSSIRLTKPFLFLIQSIHDVPCGTSMLITAVNEAGESSPSTFVLPSLPDIGPVTASLEHQVWKVNGDVMVRVSFEPADTCIPYPVERYLLVLKSPSGRAVRFILDYNETETVLNGLEDNKRYSYSVTVFNRIGNATTDSEKVLTTNDVQNISAIEVDEDTVKVRCYFINGSDAQGCLIVFISNYGQVDSRTARFDSNSTTWEEVNLNHPISCYHRVLAFDIEAGGNVSDLAVMANVSRELAILCPLAYQDSMVFIITLAAITSIFILVALILVSALILRLRNKRKNEQLDKHCNAQNAGSDLHLESPKCSIVTQTLGVPIQQLSSPPEYPAPSLEHVFDQQHELNKAIPAMYDLPENYSPKETSKMNEENQLPHKDERPFYFTLEEKQDNITSPVKVTAR